MGEVRTMKIEIRKVEAVRLTAMCCCSPLAF